MHPARTFLALPFREPEPDTPPAFTCVGPRRASPFPAIAAHLRVCGVPGRRCFLPANGQKRLLLPTGGHRRSRIVVVVVLSARDNMENNNNRIFPAAQRHCESRLLRQSNPLLARRTLPPIARIGQGQATAASHPPIPAIRGNWASACRLLTSGDWIPDFVSQKKKIIGIGTRPRPWPTAVGDGVEQGAEPQEQTRPSPRPRK